MDGPVLLAEAVAAGVALDAVYAEPGGMDDPGVEAARAAGVAVHAVQDGALAKVLDVVTPQRVVAVARQRAATLDAVVGAAAGSGRPVLVLVEIQDPGNAGTLVRVAEAAGCAGVVLTERSVDLHNPKTVRATAGALFRVPVAEGVAPADLLARCRAAALPTWALVGGGGSPVDQVVLAGPAAFLVGSEAHGLPDGLAAACDGRLTVPDGGRCRVAQRRRGGCPGGLRGGPPATGGRRAGRRRAYRTGADRKWAHRARIPRPHWGWATMTDSTGGPGPSVGQNVETLSQEAAAIAEEGARALAAATDLDHLRALDAEVLGKKSRLSALKAGMRDLDHEQRKALGAALNQARTGLEAASEARRAQLVAAERRARLAGERLDLTEYLGRDAASRVGHAHLITQTWERLEDVFVGMGFTVEAGPEVETDWFNFEALNLPPSHPARSLWDTLYLDASALPGIGPDQLLLRTHTSPVQMRTMLRRVRERTGPPIHVVCPGRVYRQDTADATHLPVFHQVEMLVVDRGRHHGRPGRDHRDLHQGLLRPGDDQPAASVLLPVHRAVGGGGHLPARRVVAGGRGLRHGPPQRAAGGRAGSRGVVGLRLRVRHRPPGQDPPPRGGPAGLRHQRHALPGAVLMRVTLSWLREFAPIEGDPAAIADQLSDLGLAVEEQFTVGEGLDGVVVARVLGVRPHPDADKIQLVDVDRG